MFDRIRKANLASRVIDEKLYDIIATEMKDGVIQEGLWLQAIAKARGSEERATGDYITLKMQSLRDEIEIASLRGQAKKVTHKIATQHELRRTTPPQKNILKHTTPLDDQVAKAVSMIETYEYKVTDRGYLIWGITSPGHDYWKISGLPGLENFALNLKTKDT